MGFYGTPMFRQSHMTRTALRHPTVTKPIWRPSRAVLDFAARMPLPSPGCERRC